MPTGYDRLRQAFNLVVNLVRQASNDLRLSLFGCDGCNVILKRSVTILAANRSQLYVELEQLIVVCACAVLNGLLHREVAVIALCISKGSGLNVAGNSSGLAVGV